MKNLFFSLALLPVIQLVQAQNVGIGISSPTAKLHVAGNIRATGRVDAEGVVEAAGLSSTGVLYVSQTSLLQGAVTGNSTASFTGSITSNNSLILNNPAGIITYRASGADKAFVQLSGDDLRLGTYSGNTTGKFIVRTGGTNNLTVTSDGNTGVGMDDPVAKLHINSGASNTTLRLQANGAPSLQFYTGTTSIGSIQPAGSNLRITAPGDNVVLNDLLYANGSSNRVGIGTSTPEQKLHVTGNIKVTGGKVLNNNDYNMVPIGWGYFNKLGTQLRGTGNLIVHRRTVNASFHCFDIEVTGVDISNAVAVANGAGPQSWASVGPSTTAGMLSVYLYDNLGSEETDFAPFYIVIYN